MSSYDPNDLAGQLLFHREWADSYEASNECAAAIYLIIKGVTGDEEFLPAFQAYWRAYSADYAARVDSYLREEGYNRREVEAAHQRRDTFLSQTHQLVTRFWQQGKVGSGEEHVLRAYMEREASLTMFKFVVALNPKALDEEAVEILRREMDAFSPKTAPHRLGQPSAFASVIVEARRATRQGSFAAILRSIDEKIRENKVPPADERLGGHPKPAIGGHFKTGQ